MSTSWNPGLSPVSWVIAGLHPSFGRSDLSVELNLDLYFSGRASLSDLPVSSPFRGHYRRVWNHVQLLHWVLGSLGLVCTARILNCRAIYHFSSQWQSCCFLVFVYRWEINMGSNTHQASALPPSSVFPVLTAVYMWVLMYGQLWVEWRRGGREAIHLCSFLETRQRDPGKKPILAILDRSSVSDY